MVKSRKRVDPGVRSSPEAHGGGQGIKSSPDEGLNCIPYFEPDKPLLDGTIEHHVTSMASQPSSSFLSPATTLPRGAACLPCRRRKMRCDGIRPFCGQCTIKQRTDDCEYPSDIQGLTKTQMMEENIALLEARIRELEDPSDDSTIKLHLPIPLAAAAPSQLPHIAIYQEAPEMTISRPTQSLGRQPSDTSVTPPTEQEVRSLLQVFVPHAVQLGFSLSVPRFLSVTQAIVSNAPMAHPSGPLYDPLLSTICLWGTRLSPDPTLRRHEDYLATRSVKLLSSFPFNSTHCGGPQGQAIVAVIQAEALLANYFFSMGRLLEGRYHCGAAASLCVSCRLNVMSSPGQGLMPLQNGTNAVAVGERVNAFWSVYALDTAWTIALGPPCSLHEQSSTANRPNMTIFTPWPMKMADYEQGHQVIFNANDRPIASLLNNTSHDASNGSPLALRAQAATLFSHASRFSSKLDNPLPVPESNALLVEFNNLNNLITRSTRNLPLIGPLSSNNPDAHELLLASTLFRVAAIQLHQKLSGSQACSRDACIQHAQAVATTIQNIGPDVKFLDPIMAILLTAVCHVFIKEIHSQVPGNHVEGHEYAGKLTKSLDQILRVMTAFGAVCPLMMVQVAQIRESRGI